MLINFPNQLTSEEEQLLKKIAKMKKKKKLYSEKKSTKESPVESTANSQASTPSSLKRPSSTSTAGKQMDAKEAAKKLIQSGAIKFETESKEKGFKRSCSRKDDPKKSNLSSSSAMETGAATYSSVTSPTSVTSPLSANSPFYQTNKFQFPTDPSNTGPNRPQNRPAFRQNSFQSNYNNQQGGGFGGAEHSNYHNRFQQQGISLYIKANNVTEDLLRSLFNANVSQAKILSIDVKSNFAFVSVDSKESAENAIQELNGKTFNDSLFAVSFARPRKQFNRNNSYAGPNFERSNSGTFNQNVANSTNSPNTTNSSNANSPKSSIDSANNSRHIINYEDV